MKYFSYLFLLALAFNVASAQHPDTLRQNGDGTGSLGFNAPANAATASSDADVTGASGQRYGLYGGVGFNSHVADFGTLPGVPNCCSRFTEGSGVGAVFGFLSEFPLSNEVVLALRAGYASQVGILKAFEFSVVLQDSTPVPALFEHTIESTPATIDFAPIVGYKITDRLSFHSGFEFGYLIRKEYHQYEKLAEPETGHFTNGKRIRNDFKGDLPEASDFQAKLVFGTSYEIPVNRSGSLIAAPEAYYALALTPVVKGLAWHVNTVRLGMAMKFAPDRMIASAMAPPPVIADAKPEPLKDVAKAEPLEPKPALSAAINAVAVGEGGVESPISTLYVEDVIATNRRPLLNYVFFDENSASIPGRYSKLTKEQASTFRTADLKNQKTLPTYYQMLNILGQRMKENPSANITIVGSNAGLGGERGNRELSRQRASTVRDYLQNVWNVSPDRMQVEARDLPSKPSNLTDPDGVAENRRVEIISDNPMLTEPLYTSDTLRRSAVPMIRFRPNAMAQAGVAEWTVVARQDGRVLRKFTGTSEVPQELDWNVDAEQGTTPRAPGTVEYSMEVKDAAGQFTRTPLANIPVEHTPLMSKRSDQSEYKQIDRFSLILFDYDKAELNSGNRRVVDMVKRKISPNATVSITGHTDRLGDEEYNRKLSEDRARQTASLLNASTSRVSGVGETEPQFPNDLPEGRFYNRTVDVLVETPVK